MANTLKNSGSMRENDTGAVRDNATGKGRFDLIPFDAVVHVKIIQAECGDFGTDINSDNVVQEVFDGIEILTQYNEIDALTTALIMYSIYRYGTFEKALEAVSHRFEAGAVKYGTHNWQKGMPYSWFIDSGLRHLLLDINGNTDEPHDQAFVWNMICLISTFHNNKKMNDVKYMKRKGVVAE